MTATQVQGILSNAESFAGLIGQTLSQDNTTRRTAEDLYGQLKKQRPDACASNLLQLMRSSSDSRVRVTCAVYLRKFFKPGPKDVGWDELTRSTKTVVKRELLAALAAEQDGTVAKQTADAVVELASQLLADGGHGWGDLLASLPGWLSSEAGVQDITREAALQVTAGLASNLRLHSRQFAPLVAGCLGSQHIPEVQVAALKTVAAFLEVLRKPRELQAYQAALALGLAALQAALAASRTGPAEQLLLTLIKTAEVEPGLWQAHMTTAVPGMLSLAGPTPAALPEDLRRLAAEFVLTLIDIKPQIVQAEVGAPALAAHVVGCCAHFLVSGISDDASWGADPMAPPDMDEDFTLGELHRYGLECAARAACALDGAAMLRAVVDMTTAWARDGSDWRRRHAVLMCLSQVVGSCKEVVGPGELASLAGLLVEALRDPHPRVRWAACHAVGVLSDDLAPEIQLQPAGGGAALLQGLTALLLEAEGPACPQRVKAQACRALVGFLEGATKEGEAEAAEARVTRKQQAQQLVLPFLEPLSGSLLAHVERCAAGQGGAVVGGRALVPTPLQEFSLDVMTHLAVCLGSAFAPAFPVAMPLVLAVLARAAPFHGPSAVASGAVSEEEATAIVRVQVGALECAAFMCRSAGPAATAEHLPALAALLGLLARPDIESSSPLLVPLLAAIEPLAACLGTETRQLLGPVLPLLSLWSGKDVGLQVFDEDDDTESSADGAAGDDDDSEDSERDDSDVTFVSYGGLDYRCAASILTAKAAAVSALEELVNKMGPSLAPQTSVVADALLPCLLDFPLEEVHVMACRAVPVLLRNYLTAVTQGSLPPSDPSASPAAVQALLHRLWQTMTSVIHPEAVPTEAAGLLLLPSGARRPAPTSATRANMIELLTRVVDCVDGTQLQQAWVASAFMALQAALTAAQQEAQDESSSEDEDKSMEADGSVDLEAEGSDAEEDEAEDTDDEGESPEASRDRLRSQVDACVAAFTRKYGDAVAVLAQQVLAAQQPEQQRGAVVAVKNGVVA